MRTGLASLLALTACAGQPSPAEPPAPATSVAVVVTTPPPPSGTQAGYIEANQHGIFIVDVFMPPGTRLTDEPGRLLRDDGPLLYYFDPTRPILRAVDLNHGTAPRTILELAPIEHPRFPSADPLASLHRQEDLSVADGVLCLDLHDRPEDPTATYNIRIDLATAVQTRHLVLDLGGDNCGVEREAERPRLCTPRGPSAAETRDGTRISLGLTAVVPMAPGPARAGAPPAP